MDISLVWLFGVAAIAVFAFVVGWLVSNKMSQTRISGAESLAEKIISEATREAEALKKAATLEAREEWHKSRLRFEEEREAKWRELRELEEKLLEQERKLDRKVDVLNSKERQLQVRERDLFAKERALKAKDEQLSEIIMKQNLRLEKIAGMSAEEAKALLMSNLEAEARREAAQIAKEIKDRAVAEAEAEASKIIAVAIQRFAADHATESTVSVVPLPNDEMKGRIIGREGRNIRSFETATGVDVIVDDTPEAVILSGFDCVRREIARIALERLVADGRIHPGRIEEMVEKARQEVEQAIEQAGEEAIFELGISDIHPKLVSMIGRLKYRTSYGQNVLQHSKEVAFLAGLMAAELGLDEQMAKRGGLLHDIGKAVDHEVGGSHTQAGYDLVRKYDEPEIIQNIILGHHGDVEPASPLTVLVSAADAISGARPGARRETLESYIKRLEQLEALADSFPGVEKAYAIQAGREVRVIVNCEEVDDAQADQLASSIAKKIESELEYPGQIKVTVIRETRAIQYAK